MTTSEDVPVYTAHDIADLFNAVPALLGFAPEDSLVAVATSGERCRFGFRLRADMPSDPAHVSGLADLVVHHLRANGAEGAIVLALTPRQDVARELLEAVTARLDEIVAVAVARSDGRRYWVAEPGCPADGVPYETSDSHLAIVTAVAAGQEILPNRAALAARLAPASPQRVADLAPTYDAAWQAVVAALDEDSDVVGPAMADLQPALDRVLSGEPLEIEQTARLCVWLSSAPVLDAVAALVTDATSAAWVGALSHCARNVPPAFSASVAALLAYASWTGGHGALALIAAERAVAEDPDHSLGGLMLDVLHRGVAPPAWRRSRDRRRAE